MVNAPEAHVKHFDQPISDFTLPGETVQDAIKRQEMEALARTMSVEGEVQLRQWAARLGKTAAEVRSIAPDLLAEMLRELSIDEQEAKDATERNLDEFATFSAERIQSYLRDNSLAPQVQEAIAQRLVPKDKVGMFIMMVDPPSRDGFSPGLSMVLVRSVPDARKHGFKFLHEPHAPFRPEPKVACDMSDIMGDRCQKLLYNTVELGDHQRIKHPAEWAERLREQTARTAAAQAAAAQAQVEASLTTSQTLQAFMEFMMQREQPAAPEPTTPKRKE